MLGSIDIIKSVYEGLNIYRKNFPGEQKQILDPLTTMIKLAILGYKPQGTKLAIDNNKIYFQEPSFTQGLLRWAYGNNRYELHHLLNPIVIAVKRCDLTNPSIRSIFTLAINGLERFEALTDEMIQYSCTKSHLAVFKEALVDDLDVIFVAEDDMDINDICYMPYNENKILFKDAINNIWEDLQNVEWDVLLFAFIFASPNI
jgi:hypothetical protein